MSPYLVAVVLISLGILCALCLIKRYAWLATSTAILAAVVALLLFEISAARPLPGPPLTNPFILWAEQGDFAWISPDRDSPPRTYQWAVPEDMRRDLRRGAPLKVEQQGDASTLNKRRGSNDQAPASPFTWTLLEPEGAEKEQP